MRGEFLSQGFYRVHPSGKNLRWAGAHDRCAMDGEGDWTPSSGIESSMLHRYAPVAAATVAVLLVVGYSASTGCSAIPEAGAGHGFGGANGASGVGGSGGQEPG